MQLITTQIRIFLAIVEAGSMTGAADHLGIGRSGVSDSLRQLETALGIRLLIRTTRRQHLTPIGEQFYRRCRELSDLSTITLEEVSEHLAEPMGTIRITTPHVPIEEKIAPALAELIKKYPRMTPELIVADERLDLIEHNIDLSLTVGDLPDSEYKVQRVGLQRDVLCVSPQLLAKKGASLDQLNDPHVLAGWPYIAHKWEGPNIVHELKNLKTGQSHRFQFERVITTNTSHAALALLKQGIGISVLPDFFLHKSFMRGELLQVLPGYAQRVTGIYAVHPFGNSPPLSVRTMIDTMKQHWQFNESALTS